ncbi:hypothetical protein ACHAXS_003102 [Conticribra weissflogii]
MSRRRILQDTDSEDDDDVAVGGGSGSGSGIGGSGKVASGTTSTTTNNGPRQLLSLTPQESSLLANCHIRPARPDGLISTEALQESLNDLLRDNVLERLEDDEISVLPSGNSNNDDSISSSGHAEYQKYSVTKESTGRFFSRRTFYHPSSYADHHSNHNDEEGPTEEALLVEITLLHNSKKGVKSDLFRTGAGKIVFGPWWNYALERVATLSIASRVSGDSGSASHDDSTSGKTGPNKKYTAILLLRALFRFLRLGLAQVVRQGKLPSLKKSFGVDWIECVSRAKRVVDAYCCWKDAGSVTDGDYGTVKEELDLVVEHLEKLGGVIVSSSTSAKNSANIISNAAIGNNSAAVPAGSKSTVTAASWTHSSAATKIKTESPATTNKNDIKNDSETEAKKRKEEASRARLDALKAKSRRAAGIRSVGSSEQAPHSTATSAGAHVGAGGLSSHSSSAAPSKGAVSQGSVPVNSNSSSVFASMASAIGSNVSGSAVGNRASISGPSSSANRGSGSGRSLSNLTAAKKNETGRFPRPPEGFSHSHHGSGNAGDGGNYHASRPPVSSTGTAAAAACSNSSHPNNSNAPSLDESWGRLRDGTQPNLIKSKGSWPARQALNAIQLTPPPPSQSYTNDEGRLDEDSSIHLNELENRDNNFDNPNRNDTRNDYRHHPSRDNEQNVPSYAERHASNESGGTTGSNVIPPNSNRGEITTMRRDNPPVLSDGYDGGQPPPDRSVGVSGRNVDSRMGGYGASMSGTGRDPVSSFSRYEEDRSEKLNRPSFREQDGGDRGDYHRSGSGGGRSYDREESSYSKSDSNGNYNRDGERSTFSRRVDDRSRDGGGGGGGRYEHRSSGGSRRHDNEQSTSSLRFIPPNREREDGELPPSKRFRHVNSGGDDRGRSSNNTSNPSAGAPGSGDAGRGRGRGRDVNLPAWMTRQDSGLGNNYDNSINNRNGPNGTSDASFSAGISDGPTGISNAPASTNGAGRGRGRGRGVNLPAWMTRQDGNEGASDSNANSGRPSGASYETANPTKDSVAGGHFHKPPAAASTRVIPPNHGGGRGRGRDVNLPAWMTRQQDGPGNDNANSGIVGGAGGGGLGRGRGRGKDINKPAWMTKDQT